MSSKFIHTVSDENPDLHKQIGCMNGLFQLFERHHFLSSRRQITHKRLPSGPNVDSNNASHKPTEKDQKKAIKEKQRISTESSRTSFSSSSCSSSLSSIECNNRASQLDPCSYYQATVVATLGRDSPTHQLSSSSFRSSQQSPDLRAVVKDSIYREARGISVKTVTRGESGNQTLKFFDSPRPLQHPKSPTPKVSGLKESCQVFHQVQESPRKSNEVRRGSLPSTRRFSCDGRESRDASKSIIKVKELPRLSLDSRAGSIRSSASQTRSSYALGDLERRDRNSNNFFSQPEEPESRTKLSNVVAKLMGLEGLPDSTSAAENQTRRTGKLSGDENHRFLGSPRTTEDNRQSRVPGSPRNLHKEPISPRIRATDLAKKSMPNSRFPLETAPWKQSDGSRSSLTPALKNQGTPPKAQNTPLTVYGEIEKRLAQLEFKQSGKDLRALKQILEAMQKTKEILETKSQAAQSDTQATGLQRNSESSNLCNNQNESPMATLNRRSNSPTFKSPIVIMKPAKLVQKASNPAPLVNRTERFSAQQRLQAADTSDGRKESVAQDLTPRANHLRERSSPPSRLTDKTAAGFARLPQTLTDSQSTTSSGRSFANLNLRQPQKKFGLEKQTRPTTPTSDSIRTTRQSNRQPTESVSPRRKSRSRSSNFPSSDDELSVGSDVRDLSHHGDAISMHSGSSAGLASQADEEVSSNDRSFKITNQKNKKPVARSMKERSVPERVVIPEQSSPVSVLDAAFYDDLPSPIKKKSIAFKEDEVECNQIDESHSFNSRDSSLNKAENIHLLIQKITQKLSSHQESFVTEIPNFCESTNPDHQYISEILSASGLLKDFESGFTANRLLQTGYPINPTLFLSLEQTKTSKLKVSNKLHRKLLFDAVNEILIHKLLLESSSKYGLLTSTLAEKRPRGQQLWEELCSEVDKLQGNVAHCSLGDDEDSLEGILRADLMHQSKNWSSCSSEIPGLVLDIERLIFKDLVSETITSEILGLRVQSAGYCKQLFSK